MLIAAQKIFGTPVHTVDGKAGSITDIYFDGDAWNVRYLIVDTGIWLPGRKILLAPAAVEQADWPNQSITVRQTKQQLEESPPIWSDKPVSRQYEIELADHFHWPYYWGAGGVAPVIGVPPVGDRVNEFGLETKESSSSASTRFAEEGNDPNLRSAKEVKTYHIEATDGDIGHVEDFVVDDAEWIIRYLIINTRNWLPGKSVLVAPKWAESISWPGRRLQVGLTRDAIKESPEFNPASPINRQYEEHLYDYYGREKYW